MVKTLFKVIKQARQLEAGMRTSAYTPFAGLALLPLTVPAAFAVAFLDGFWPHWQGCSDECSVCSKR